LKNLLGLYKNAVEFVTFFGDSRNNRRIESNLKSLRSLFDESFNAAVTIRQVINKIVKQLSNLPTASPTSGALNLDINVPGGPLKQAGQRATRGVLIGGRGKALAVGAAGVAGVGLLGMQSAQARQEEKLAATAKKPGDEDSIFNDFIDGLNNIIERFSEAVESLLGGGKGKSGSSGASSSASSSSPDRTPGSYNPSAPIEPGSFSKAGNLIASEVEASYYDPSLGGINASGVKTPSGEPATSTGEPYRSNVFSAAAFPSFLRRLPKGMTIESQNNPSGRTLSSGQAFNVLVFDPKTNKAAIVRINDVGSGVKGQPDNRMLDFSVAAKDYFGQNVSGLQIYSVDSNSTPGPIPSNSPILKNIIRPRNSTPIQSPPPPPQELTSMVNPAPPSGIEISNVSQPIIGANVPIKIASVPGDTNLINLGGSNQSRGGGVVPVPDSGQSSNGSDVAQYIDTSYLGPGFHYRGLLGSILLG